MGERELTMVNTNIAPQWQRFNGGNWAVLEAAVRTYSARNNRELFIFTGTGNIHRGMQSLQMTILHCSLHPASIIALFNSWRVFSHVWSTIRLMRYSSTNYEVRSSHSTKARKLENVTTGWRKGAINSKVHS